MACLFPRMLDPDHFDPAAYVAAAAAAVGLDLPPDRQRDVAAAFALIVRVVSPALAFKVPAEVEPAPVFAADAP